MAPPPSSPSEEFLDALRRLIHEEIAKGLTPEEPTRIRWPRVAVVVLVGINIALTLTLFEQVLPNGKIFEVAMKVVPFLFGAAFVALLDELRGNLLRLCGRAKFVWTMVAFLLVIGSAHMFLVIPGLIPVGTAVAAELQFDGKIIPRDPDTVYVAEILGYKEHHLIVNEKVPGPGGDPIPTSDTLYFGFRDRLRASFPARIFLGRHTVRPESLYPVTLSWPAEYSQPLRLTISGEFSERVLARIEALQQVQVESTTTLPQHGRYDPVRKRAVLVAQVEKDGALPMLSLPVGSFSVRVEAAGCRAVEAALPVVAKANSFELPSLVCSSSA
jgi:hypothetical protein